MIAHRCLVVVFAIGITASCAHVPRMHTESSQTEKLRTQYLRSHPDGPHNAQIVRGEITKGMDLMEVLASWGVPERRIGKKTSKQEMWVYAMRDPYSLDSMVYELVFVDRVLSGWSYDRETSGNGVRNAEASQVIDTPRPDPMSTFVTPGAQPKK